MLGAEWRRAAAAAELVLATDARLVTAVVVVLASVFVFTRARSLAVSSGKIADDLLNAESVS